MSMESGSGETPNVMSSGRLVAPSWHTAVVVLLFVGLAIAGAMSKGNAALTQPARSHGPLYLSLIAAEVGLIYLVRLGLRKGGTSMSAIVGKMDPSIPGWVRDILVASVLWGVWI